MLDDLHAMLTGPGKFRFIIQPLIAIFLGLRDGKLDAQAGRAPFVLSLFQATRPNQLLVQALRQVAVPLTVAIVMDAILQFVILGSISVLWALVIGTALIALPYSVSRGLTNRILRNPPPRHA